LEKIFRHTFSQKIWSIGYFQFENEKFLWIETKNDLQINWQSISLKSFQINSLQNPNYSLSWIKSIDQIGIFAQPKSGKNPGIQSIEAYDLLSGKKMYHIDCSFWFDIQDMYMLVDIQQQKQWIDLRSGKFQSKLPDVIATDSTQLFQENPTHYEENQTYFKEFQDFFQEKFQENISKGIEYWEGKDKLVFSYYIYDLGWKNYLKVCDTDFNIQHIELISEGDLMGYNTFQIIENKLIYVTNKQQIVIYEY
jgi:hypothetical protein